MSERVAFLILIHIEINQYIRENKRRNSQVENIDFYLALQLCRFLRRKGVLGFVAFSLTHVPMQVIKIKLKILFHLL